MFTTIYLVPEFDDILRRFLPLRFEWSEAIIIFFRIIQSLPFKTKNIIFPSSKNRRSSFETIVVRNITSKLWPLLYAYRTDLVQKYS